MKNNLKINSLEGLSILIESPMGVLKQITEIDNDIYSLQNKIGEMQKEIGIKRGNKKIIVDQIKSKSELKVGDKVRLFNYESFYADATVEEVVVNEMFEITYRFSAKNRYGRIDIDNNKFTRFEKLR